MMKTICQFALCLRTEVKWYSSAGWNDPSGSGATDWGELQSATTYTFVRTARGYYRHETKSRKVRIKRSPFAEGAMRAAYFFQDLVNFF
jgi:hypothetical protein